MSRTHLAETDKTLQCVTFKVILYVTDSTFGMPKMFRKDTLCRPCCKWNNININIKEKRLFIFSLLKDVGQ
jgi:hypothetical protein